MPDLRSFGRRRGRKLRPGRSALLEGLLPRLAIPQPAEGERLDPWRLFPSPPRALWLEVGFGGGEHLAAQAAANPDVGLIGCEIFLDGIASLLRHVEAGGLGNVRLFPEDARRLLPALPDACLERVFVLFPDPWPKKRHAERRFLSPSTLGGLGRLLRDGGELRVATDDVTYVRWVLRHAPRHPAFRWLVSGPGDWRNPPPGAAPTRYETKAIAAGRSPFYFRFQRRPRQEVPEIGCEGGLVTRAIA
ncbi:MAG: tRNA (guanine(46)-N(7))-methyltransferase TrmB [Alphaproteobacteria bacterium]